MKCLRLLLLLLLPVAACDKNDDDDSQYDKMYFPSANEWETRSLSGLGWDAGAVPALKEFLIEKNTRSFMILVNGRIVMEEYFNGHTPAADWQWNSAGKTLVAAATGIAQQEGLLNIDNKVSDYLGTGWTSEPAEKEDLITVKHLLTMTSGINDENNLVIRANLTYLADAGTRWSYHNVFQLLMDVVAEAGGLEFEDYFNSRLRDRTGMDGYWNDGVIFNVYHSSTRSMARFGLLALNRGKWKDEQIVNELFFNESVTSSQNINPSYGYLWWLNGKTGYMVPGSQAVFTGHLIPDAPPDMYAAMGAEDQRIYVVPGRNMVVVRMGEASDPRNPSFALSGFDNDLWEKINSVLGL